MMGDLSFDNMYTISEQVVKQLADLDEHCTLMLTDAERIDESLRQLRQCREEEACRAYACAPESRRDYERLDCMPANGELKKIANDYDLALSEILPEGMQDMRDTHTYTHSDTDTDTDTDHRDRGEAYNRSFQLREQYLSSLSEALDDLHVRMDKMGDLFDVTAELQQVVEEHQNELHKRMLSAEHEQSQQQLQAAAERPLTLEEQMQQVPSLPLPVEEEEEQQQQQQQPMPMPVADAEPRMPIPMISPLPLTTSKRNKRSSKSAANHDIALHITEDEVGGLVMPKSVSEHNRQPRQRKQQQQQVSSSKSSTSGQSVASGQSYSVSQAGKKPQQRHANVCTATLAAETAARKPPVKEKFKRQLVKKNASTTTRKN